MVERITNNEVFPLANLLAEMKVCLPGTIPPLAADKMISLMCDLQEAAVRLQKRIDLVREQTRPEGVGSWQEASEEQRESWNRAMTGQLDLLGNKTAGVTFEPLTRDEFATVAAANTLTGAQAAFLRNLLVKPDATGKGGEHGDNC